MPNQAHQVVAALLAEDEESPKDFLKRHDMRGGLRKAWPEWDELEEWQRTAVNELDKDQKLDVELECYGDDSMRVADGHAVYAIYRDFDIAKQAAIDEVRRSLQDDPEMFDQNWLSHYIDEDRLRSALTSDVESLALDRFLEEHPDYESRRNQLIEDAILARDDFFDPETDEELPITLQMARAIDGAADEWAEQEAAAELRDPMEYMENIYGRDEAVKQAMDIAGVDYDKAAEEAVETDGVAHFLAQYDHNEIDLRSGAVAFRTG